jgi:beta-lactamase regulating signal transducer with metallopeptidase domain
MNDFAISMTFLIAQVSAVMIVALGLDAWLARRSPNAAGRVLFVAILALPILTAAIFCPLPRWWSWQDDAKPIARTESNINAEQGIAAVSAKPDATVLEQAERGVPLLKLLQSLPAVGAHWQPSPRTGRILALVWLAGGCLCGIRLLGGLWSVGRLRRRSRSVSDEGASELLRSLRSDLQLRRTVELREADVPGLPATMGWRRPIILLPPTWKKWGNAELRSALAHELAHIAAGDYLSSFIAQLAVALHFYHPLTIRLMNRLRLRREMAADALAARHAGGRREYLRALARLALYGEPAGTGVPAPLLLSAHGGVLFRRIQMLRNTEEARPLSRMARGLALALLASSALLASTLRSPAGAPDAEATANAATSSDSEPFDLSYLAANPDPVHAVVGFRPAVLLAQPGMAEYARLYHRELEAALKSMGRSMPDGISLADVEQIVVDAAFSVNSKAPPPNRSVMVGTGHLMIRMRKEVDWAKALSAIFGKLKTTTQDSYTILTANFPLLGPQDVSFCVIDARTILVVQEKDGKFLTPVKSAKCPVNLGPSWSKVERSPLAIGFDNHDGYFTGSSRPKSRISPDWRN